MNFQRLGKAYAKRQIVGPTGDHKEVLMGIMQFIDSLKDTQPALYRHVQKMKNIDWNNVDWEAEQSVADISQTLFSAMDKIAPEGTEFQQSEADSTWRFIPADNVLEPNRQSDQYTEITPLMNGVMVQEKHIKYIIKEASRVIIAKLGEK